MRHAPLVWLSWLESCPVHQNVAGLISQQGTSLGCGFCSKLGRIWEIAFSLCLESEREGYNKGI